MVYIVSTGCRSRIASRMLYNLLIEAVNIQPQGTVTKEQICYREYNFDREEEVEEAVNKMLEQTKVGLYIIADEAGPENGSSLKKFCKMLESKVSHLHLWAAGFYFSDVPEGWKQKHLTTPLRSPPVVENEIVKQKTLSLRMYGSRLPSDDREGPEIIEINHQSHTGGSIKECVMCGREIGKVLYNLRKGKTSSTSQDEFLDSALEWRHMLVLYSDDFDDYKKIVKGLREERVSLRAMRDKPEDFDDISTARSDVVWIVNGDYVRGIERKVVVCLDDNDDVRLRHMSRCTSQLVLINR